jgi:hypothetical protein
MSVKSANEQKPKKRAGLNSCRLQTPFCKSSGVWWIHGEMIKVAELPLLRKLKLKYHFQFKFVLWMFDVVEIAFKTPI